MAQISPFLQANMISLLIQVQEHIILMGTSDIGIIGSATPFGWDSDVDMTKNDVDTNLYSVTMELVVGEAKFRQNDDWAVNWEQLIFLPA
jgi:hypothetical protein